MDRRRNSAKGWLVFLKNHREAIAAIDFFTVPTVTFRVVYCFFVISHSRRRILHFNATEHPTAQWIVQQLREAFPEDRAPRYLVLDRDGKFSGEVMAMLKWLGSELIRTAYRSPWQNGMAERWVGSCRRELLDHVIVLSGDRPFLSGGLFLRTHSRTSASNRGAPRMRPVGSPRLP